MKTQLLHFALWLQSAKLFCVDIDLNTWLHLDKTNDIKHTFKYTGKEVLQNWDYTQYWQ